MNLSDIQTKGLTRLLAVPGLVPDKLTIHISEVTGATKPDPLIFRVALDALAACRSEKNRPNSRLFFANKWGAALHIHAENKPKWGFSQQSNVSPTGC